KATEMVFPLSPRGDTREAGLQKYRIYTDAEFPAGGTLEFRKGKDVLWKQDGRFEPAKVMTTGLIPASVLKQLKAGDVVTWGVFDVDGKGKNVTAKFTVEPHKDVDSALAKFEADPKVRSQSALVRNVGRAQILLNH